MSAFNPLMIPLAGIAGWIIVTWIRAHYGIASPFERMHEWSNKPNNAQVPPMFHKMLEKAMAERDAEIQNLRERIEVLEQIVTDGHKAKTLADEIENLRDVK